MHDGIVRILSDVQHVSDLAKNLVSIGTLEINGCKYTRHNGIMKISRGTLIIMKARRSRSLYVLHKKIITRITVVLTSTMFVTPEVYNRQGAYWRRGMPV